MIDSHCHLDVAEYNEDRPAVLARARAAGVAAMVCIGSGSDMASARNATVLADAETDIYATVGIHPHDVAQIPEATWTELAHLSRHARVVGIGETGLDYFYDRSPREAQRDAFRRFIALARAVRRPVISHVRDAHEDAAAILTDEHADDVGGVIHCFTGGVADARRYLDLGHCLSFSGILTFKNADPIREAAAFAPADRILIETDAPFLAPVPHRGKRNEPAYIVQTLEVLATVRGTTVAALDDLTAANTRRLFRLPA